MSPRDSLTEDFPTLEQVTFFEQHGYVISPHILPQDLIASARYGVMRYDAGERDWHLPISGGFLDWREEHGDGLRINDYVSLQNRELRDLVMYPALGRAFAALARAAEIRLFHDQLISKAPDHRAKTAIGWHVDGSYWHTCTSDRMLTAWIPLESYDETMGPLNVIEGSHRWDGNAWMTTFNEQDLDGLQARIASAGKDVTPVPVLIEPGQVSFHHARTIHGSLPNRGDRPRVALTVHVQDGSNRYRAHHDCRGKLAVHVNDALCRKGAQGEPDYTDPDICPLLWPQDAGRQ